MLKSLCIKTNNKNIIKYLLNSLEKLKLDNLYISNLKFKVYQNVIIHYNGTNIISFLNSLSDILSDIVIMFYEKDILKRTINLNYFYFTDLEQRDIFNICIQNLSSTDLDEITLRKNEISSSFSKYFIENKSLILDGFIKFRLNNYMKILDSIIDLSVNKYVIDREYFEFIELLKAYINSKEYASNIIHLVYSKQEAILLDEFNNVISMNISILNSKYLSDITFSSNDFALNALLTLLPEKINIHIIDEEDDFINTLKLIFDFRVNICHNCNICNGYKFNSNAGKCEL